MTAALTVSIERWPIAGGFTISRGTKTEAVVVVAEIRDGDTVGRGECVPYARYGETVEGIRDTISALSDNIAAGLTRADLQDALPAGAARNAVDCALWDFEAKRAGKPAWSLAGLGEPRPLVTAYTLSLGTPDSMLEAARKAARRPLLKVKLGGDGDAERIAAVREGAPDARLILDAASQYVIPAKVFFVADVAQFTPKTVETTDERQKLMFRVKARIPSDRPARAGEFAGLDFNGATVTLFDNQSGRALRSELNEGVLAHV